MTPPDPAPAGPLPPCLILVRPQLPENVGMAARGMMNFGLTDLRLVAPRDGWSDHQRAAAATAAVNAGPLVMRARVFATAAEAVGDLARVLAATARRRAQAKPVLAPGEAMAGLRALAEAGRPTGVLFGPERVGLDNDEVALADAVLTFPVSEANPSLNLAHAAVLTAHEWARGGEGGGAGEGAGEAAPPAPPRFTMPPHGPPAARVTVLGVLDHLEEALAAAGYFQPPDKRDLMARNLRNILLRLDLTEGEASTLRGVVTALAGRRPGGKG